MLVLGIETSGNLCSVAFWEDGRVLAEYNHEIPMKHTELIGGLIQKGLDFIEKEVDREKTVDLVVAAIGPGSFTGLRIGLSYAQGYCFGRTIPIVGISNQQVLATQRINNKGIIYTAIDARRDEFFIAEHKHFPGKFNETFKQEIVKTENLIHYFDAETEIIFEHDCNIDAEILKSLGDKRCLIHKKRFSASILAEIGFEKFIKTAGDDPDTLEPMYVRPFAGVQ